MYSSTVCTCTICTISSTVHIIREIREYFEYVGMSTEQCVRILVLIVHSYTVVTVCSCSPIEMQIRLRGARETIYLI